MLLIDKPRVLAIGAHPDDIELGAGGLIYRLVQEKSADVHFLVLTGGLHRWQQSGSFQQTTREREAKDGAQALGVPARNVTVLDLQDCSLHQCVHQIIEAVESRLYADTAANYDLILTHSPADTHSDHKQVYESTVSAVRYFRGTVLSYQAPSTIPNSFHPTFFVSLDAAARTNKSNAISKHQSQRDKDFTSATYTEGIARSWALFHRRPADFLEAFEVYKTYWD